VLKEKEVANIAKGGRGRGQQPLDLRDDAVEACFRGLCEAQAQTPKSNVPVAMDNAFPNQKKPKPAKP
jgi:hypothetical protein